MILLKMSIQEKLIRDIVNVIKSAGIQVEIKLQDMILLEFAHSIMVSVHYRHAHGHDGHVCIYYRTNRGAGKQIWTDIYNFREDLIHVIESI